MIFKCLLLTTPIAGLVWWLFAWMGGFRLWGKIPERIKKLLRKIYPIPAFTMGGAAAAIAVGVISMHGCNVIDSMAAALMPETASVSSPKSRDLGKIASPSFEVLHRIKLEADKRTERQERQEKLQKKAIEATDKFPWFDRGGLVVVNNIVKMIEPKPHTRKPPFCHVTCTVHHGAQYDRETLAEYCRANWIPPSLENMPGWWPVSDTEEVTEPWPGPATEGFESYKLYWLDH
jgi:hypothetical protein